MQSLTPIVYQLLFIISATVISQLITEVHRQRFVTFFSQNNTQEQVDVVQLMLNRKKQKQYILDHFTTMKPYQPEPQQLNQQIIIGYYPFRAKAQLPRLICQFLHINYVDQYFTPDHWSKYKERQAKDWIVKDLPFLKHGNFVVTGPPAIILYILELTGRTDLLGRNLADKIKIDSIKSKHDLKNAILGLICVYRPSNLQEDKNKLLEVWRNKIEPILKDYENECPDQGWYYGYITIMDFVVYELLGLISYIFPQEVSKFKKLLALKSRFYEIQQIKNYQNSNRAVKQYSPVAYFSRFKQQKMKTRRVSSNSKDNRLEMEIQ